MDLGPRDSPVLCVRIHRGRDLVAFFRYLGGAMVSLLVYMLIFYHQLFELFGVLFPMDEAPINCYRYEFRESIRMLLCSFSSLEVYLVANSIGRFC